MSDNQTPNVDDRMSDEIPHKTSLRFHRLIVKIDIELKDFACNTPNCVLSESDWRCTYYGYDFTINIFKASKLSYPAIVCMTFHNKSLESIEDDFEKLFGKRPESDMTTAINWVEKFYTPYNSLDLDRLYDMLSNSDDCAFVERVYNKKKKKNVTKKTPGKIKCYSMTNYDSDDSTINRPAPRVPKNPDDKGDDATVSMDQKKFCALVLHPFPSESNFAIEIFSSGVLNVPGIPSEEYFEKIKKYVNETLAPIMDRSRCGDSQSVDIEDFTF